MSSSADSMVLGSGRPAPRGLEPERLPVSGNGHVETSARWPGWYRPRAALAGREPAPPVLDVRRLEARNPSVPKMRRRLRKPSTTGICDAMHFTRGSVAPTMSAWPPL